MIRSVRCVLFFSTSSSPLRRFVLLRFFVHSFLPFFRSVTHSRSLTTAADDGSLFAVCCFVVAIEHTTSAE